MTKFNVDDRVMYVGSLPEAYGREYIVSRVTPGEPERYSVWADDDHHAMFGIKGDVLLDADEVLPCDSCKKWFEYGTTPTNCYGTYCPDCTWTYSCHDACYSDD